MPPKISITKEMIQQAAFTMVQTQGMDAVNARSLAQQLNCSTQPIFRAYKNMDELKQEVVTCAERLYNQKMMEGLSHPVPFLGMGLAYIHFALEEPRLFHLLFLDHRYTIFSFDQMISGPDNEKVIYMLSAAAGASIEQAKRLYIGTWLLTHGIATMLATNKTHIPEVEIEAILMDGYSGLKKQILGVNLNENK